MQYPMYEKKSGQEKHVEAKVKRLFSFEKDSVMSNQIKKFKAHTDQVSSITKRSLKFEYDFMKHSQVQESNILDKEHATPLVEKLRPTNIGEYVGQKQIIGPDTVLRYLFEKREISSMIFWGPPGCGKTSLANIIAHQSKETNNNVNIVNLSAANSGVKDIRDIAAAAKRFDHKTIVFMDEIHRFNKLQQDIFLPHVEAATFILIGCTTENPSYSLNPALLSRCRVFMLSKLTDCDIKEILYRGIEYMNGSILDIEEEGQTNDGEHMKFYSNSTPTFYITVDTMQWLTEACNGDASLALNTLELSALTKGPDKPRTSQDHETTITLRDVKKNLIQTYMLSEKESSQSHHMYSALHKSIRAGKASASLYWLARIMAAREDPVNIARRLVRISSEDIGLADPDALGVAVHTMHGCQMIGMPECDVLLGQCAVYLARAPKSRLIYNALKAAEKVISEYKGPQPTVPLHMRCNSTERTFEYTNNLRQESCSKASPPD